MKERAIQLAIEVCPELFYGTLREFFDANSDEFGKPIDEVLNGIFYDNLLEKPSILDSSVVEEGFCIRIDKYPKPEIYKIKSKKFLAHESEQLDKEVKDIETEETI